MCKTSCSSRYIANKDDRNRSNADRGLDFGTLSYRLHPPRKVEARVMYRQDYDTYNDKERIGIPAVHAITTSTNTKNDNRPIKFQQFINMKRGNLNVAMRNLQQDYQDRCFTTTILELWFVPPPSMGQYRNSFLLQYDPTYYITFIIQNRQDVRIEGERTTEWEESITGRPWRMMYKRL